MVMLDNSRHPLKHFLCLDIGNQNPVALFGCCNEAVAIGSEGEIIKFNISGISLPAAESVSLQDGEKASSLSLCFESIVAIITNCRVFESPDHEDSQFLPTVSKFLLKICIFVTFVLSSIFRRCDFSIQSYNFIL